MGETIPPPVLLLKFTRPAFFPVTQSVQGGVPLWCSKLRFLGCHCSSLGHYCGEDLIPGLGTCTCCVVWVGIDTWEGNFKMGGGGGKKKKKKKKSSGKYANLECPEG